MYRRVINEVEFHVFQPFQNFLNDHRTGIRNTFIVTGFILTQIGTIFFLDKTSCKSKFYSDFKKRDLTLEESCVLKDHCLSINQAKRDDVDEIVLSLAIKITSIFAIFVGALLLNIGFGIANLD
ncbi:MAG: hypothetical protein JHC93_08460 [Parachlamydiales bacterium]|nr:hypothetical protein [Parachlamydiales bacterium]